MVRTRALTALAGAVTLVVGVVATVPASAEPAAPIAGGIVAWGTSSESYSADDGPWAASSQLTSTVMMGLKADGSVVKLKGGATLDVPDSVSSTRAVAVASYADAAAVLVDGSLVLWGSPTRGLTKRTYTPADLGGGGTAVKAVDVEMGGVVGVVLLEDGRAGLLSSFGYEIIADPDSLEEVTGVTDIQMSGNVVYLLAGNTVLEVTTSGITVVGSGPVGDPLVDIAGPALSSGSPDSAFQTLIGVTESGVVYSPRREIPEPNFPTDQVSGKVVQIAGAGGQLAARTDTGQVIVWKLAPLQGGTGPATPNPGYEVPTTVSNLKASSIEGGDRFRAIVTDSLGPVLDPLSVTAQPSISGTPQVGQLLTATPAAFNDTNATVTGQWFAGGQPITGATGTTLVLTTAHKDQTITYKSTATRASDSAELTSEASNALGPVTQDALAPLTVTTQPIITGTPQVGQTLSATPGTFSDSGATVTGQWKAGTEGIAGATGTTLVLSAAHQGATITYVSKATRTADGATATSNASNALGPVAAAPPPAKTVPTVSVSASGGTYGRGATVSVAVSAGATGAVTLLVNGVPLGTAGLSGGAAAIGIPATLAPGTYSLSASYSGSATHAAASGAGTLSIAKGAAKKPTFKANKAPTSKKAGKATVKVSAPAGLAKASGKVTVTLKKGGSSKKVAGKLKNGKVSVKLPKLKKGSWKVTVAYNGDGNYNKGKSKSYKLKIKK